MNTRTRHARSTALAVAGTLLAALAVGAATPAVAAGADRPAASATALPPIDRDAVRQAIGDLPNAYVTGAFVRVTGSAGRYETSAGLGDAATGSAPDPEGRFRIGSISKVFTAAVVLQLAGEHRIDLDGTVQQYLPGVLPADLPPVTVGQLLDHTSGLPGGGKLNDSDGSTAWFAAHRFDSWTPQQVVASLAGQPMSFPPGTAQQYNGINYYLAGLLIEKTTGHSYADEVQRRLIRPLHLRDTAVPDRDDPRLAHPASHGYLTVHDPDGTTHPVDVTEQSPWPWAEGGLISSAPDLDRFLGALLQGRLLPAAEQQRLFDVPDVPNQQNSHCTTGPTAGRACMSMGLERVDINGVTLWGKTGSRPGYVSGVFATRDLGRRIVYSLNPTGFDGAESRYILRLAQAVFPAAPAAGTGRGSGS
ncbi:serine hydrolase domain-containing protein [Kitasatospora paracochleata]|uniref:D-alanyl-D-alanine carboxypeptidase n=1 Tax=Kitasatospora paracochleata TaxID=58354 RepID=A0ABT1IR11_9ACTN|nr:serine hydrolase domain-containing protein [Kitasatospora paracochleata]MCP2307378.1 D-alanyl-D-alanine carboxypeptidase [Kitasatospora paracochleata]